MAGKRHVLIGNHPPMRREDQHSGLHVNSFSIGYRGGSIWIEHLDAMDEEDLAPKLTRDLHEIRKPSTSSFLAVNVDETPLSRETFSFILGALDAVDKPFLKVAFVGLSPKLKRYAHKYRGSVHFVFACFDDFELAKEWLLCGKYS